MEKFNKYRKTYTHKNQANAIVACEWSTVECELCLHTHTGVKHKTT